MEPMLLEAERLLEFDRVRDMLAAKRGSTCHARSFVSLDLCGIQTMSPVSKMRRQRPCIF